MREIKEKNKDPRAELVTFTKYPIETIFYLWNKSKDKEFNMTVEEIRNKISTGLFPKFEERVEDTFRKVISQEIPVAENIDFVFMIFNDPIAHREQMVRHRIGVHFGDNFGVDVIPDQQKSTYWSQSMRIMDYSRFATDDLYFIPESIKNNPNVLESYKNMMGSIQDCYGNMIHNEIPMEDARGILPLHATMDISWKMNLSALLHIIGKRSCWILQYGLWGYIISSMVNELVEKVHPIFREIAHPPCFCEGGFKECTFMFENERRLTGEDKLPLCPLYEHHHTTYGEMDGYKERYPEMVKRQIDLAPKYSNMWDRHAWTGKKENDLKVIK